MSEININNAIIVPTDEQFRPYIRKFNDIVLFEPTTITKTGTELEFENTYNSECELIKVYGDSYQEQNNIAVKSGNIMQFDDHKGDYMVVTSPVDCTVTRCGKNLYKYPVDTSTISYSTAWVSFDGITSFYSQSNYIKSNQVFYLPSGNYQISFNDYVNMYSPQLVNILNDSITTSTFTSSGDNYVARCKIEDITLPYYVEKAMLTYGQNNAEYENYIGDDFEIFANVPTKIQLIDGINTVFANVETELVVNYLSQDETLSNLSPSVEFPEEILCVNGEFSSSNDEKSSNIIIPNLYRLEDMQDILYVDKSQKRMWIEHNVEALKLSSASSWTSNESWDTLASDYLHVRLDISNWLIGQSNALSNFFPFTTEDNRNFSNEEISFHTENNSFYVFISKNRLNSADLDGFKQWLDDNEVYLYYQLSEPIIEELAYENLKTYPYLTQFSNTNDLTPELEVTVQQYM